MRTVEKKLGSMKWDAKANKDITFVRNVLTFLDMTPTGPTPLIIDNEGMWHNVRNAVSSARTKHFELWQQFVRQSFMRLKLSVHLCKTVDERADLLTKAMPKDNASYKLFRDDIMNAHSVA